MTAYNCNEATLVPLEKVSVRPGWQGAQFMDPEKVKCFVAAMQNGAEFPPIQVGRTTDDGYWVMDGHHRFSASHQCLFTEIPVKIEEWPRAIDISLR